MLPFLALTNNKRKQRTIPEKIQLWFTDVATFYYGQALKVQPRLSAQLRIIYK